MSYSPGGAMAPDEMALTAYKAAVEAALVGGGYWIIPVYGQPAGQLHYGGFAFIWTAPDGFVPPAPPPGVTLLLPGVAAALQSALPQSVPPPTHEAETALSVPAADRFVSLEDNRHEIQEARRAVDDLASLLKGSNNLFADPEERLYVLREVGLLQSSLSGPTVRLATLWQATVESGPIRWLAKESASAAVKAAVERAVAALLALIRSLVSAL